eukprot:CAMPEP_0177786000 /NCGR_PEP_ID=MMETSP0491_2-20121128/20670_1 /TAXON_ID=63592 /ORGANISM="Tetraselmis chuii, Strain PLY429" /LENGTH=67 /DNA_ID=CAMNT_0019307143 /DNA_START=109 /DNA_END=312 /DNA_ORIENTATION=+
MSLARRDSARKSHQARKGGSTVYGVMEVGEVEVVKEGERRCGGRGGVSAGQQRLTSAREVQVADMLL